MSHVPYRAEGTSYEAEADFVVVGSGAGGASAAVVLARAGLRVAIVEAGAWRDPDDYPWTTYGAMRDLFDDWASLLARGRALWPIVQGRAVGGTTVINSAIAVRTPDDIFEQWQREQGVDGARLKTHVHAAQDRIERELCVSEVPPGSRGRSNELALLAGQRAGIEGHVMRRYVKDCQGTGQCLQGCRGRRKQSTNLNYVPEVRDRGGLVLSAAPVERVVFEGRRAIGVAGRFVHPLTRKRGDRFLVRARRGVVVAASATHSPALLLRSGVKSPELGRWFRAHPGTGVFGCYDAPVDMNIGATQGWASLEYRRSPGLKLETLAIPPEMVIGRLSGGGPELIERMAEYRHLAMWVHAVRAESVGTVSNGWFGKPIVRYGFNRADMERLRAGIQIVAKLHFEAGAKAILPGIFGLPYKLGPDQLGLLADAPLDPRAYIAILSHLFGGCVMGSDASRGVTDDRGRVHGYEHLMVADASVIPSNLGVNPQHTIMGLAAHFAESWV